MNGERGIRTLDTGLTPYNGLANRRLQPLGHLSQRGFELRNLDNPSLWLNSCVARRADMSVSSAVNCHRRFVESPSLRSARQLVTTGMLHGEDGRKALFAPRVEHSVEHP